MLTTEQAAFYYAQGKAMIHGPGPWTDEFLEWFHSEDQLEG